jgi:four helix bundle suffix protein
MVKAARSGVQSIAEGSKASGTSKKAEPKLTNVARASLEELRLDCEDYLRQHGLPQWERDDPRRQVLVDRRCSTVEEVAEWVQDVRHSTKSTKSTSSSEAAANGALTLSAVACSLLDRQLSAQAKTFEQDGGFTERLYRTRSQRRNQP